ncbi:MAG: hypothetical protein HY658_00830 [Actinobacteria bacterium]|nr:hypothetical protein [Actinomycetota bacterium]
MYRFFVFLHVVGAFGFVMAHGASAAVAIRLRREREVARIASLVELSSSSLTVLYVSLLLLLVGGVTAGFLGHWWGEGWIWTAIGVFFVLMMSMYSLANSWVNAVRQAVGVQTYEQAKKKIDPSPPGTPEEIAAVVTSSRPFLILAVGAGGLGVLLWLMVYKPF